MAEKFVDTREQSIAQSFDRHISVTANAGSGKTFILKKRFLNIALHHGADFEPARIVAITFTRKAAGEIFAKIAEEIEELLKQKLTDTEHKLLFNIRSNLKSANISTIHSFCSSLLRDFPIEAGVAPNFIELNEADKMKLTNDAIVSILSEKLSNPEYENEKYRHLFRTFGRNNIENIIKNLLGKMESYSKIQNVYMKDNQQIIDWIIDEYFTAFLIELKPLMEQLISSSKAMENIIHKKGLDYNWKIFTDTFKTIYNEILFLENPEIADFDKLYDKLDFQKESLIADKLLTKAFKVNGTTYSAKSYIIEPEINNGFIQFFSHLSRYEILLERENLPVTLNYARIFLELTESVINYIDNEKESNNYLDFDDLLLKANQMLKNQETCDKIRKRFDYIMIDEFQDTNDIQYEIVKSLIPELIEPVANNDINLFIVGDPKQSIYGFRNADVRVFNKAIEDINNVNQELIQKNIISDKIFNSDKLEVECVNSEILGKMELSISFRHQPVISSFTNSVCRNIMSIKESEYDVSYSDLICTKNVEEIQLLSDAERKNLSSDYGSVTFITSIEKKDDESIEETESIAEEDNEFELLAKHLKNIVESSNYSNKYSYKDIAILGRTKARFGLLTVAFQKYGIPYILQSGKGFYETQEVLDLLSVLKFLHNNMDDVALVGALRSPFFGTSDELLTTLAYQYRGECFWNKIQKFLEENNDELLIRARNILLKLLEYSTKLSISHLLLQIIEMTAFDGAIVNIQGNTQIRANVDKLIQMARDFESRGFRNLYDFVEEVNFISSESTKESEAVILTDNDAVNVMTIHASKGLEFPIIALIDTMSGTGGNFGLIIDDKYGLGFKTPEYNSADDVFENNNNLIYSIIKNRDSKKESAELKRLVYVALTRAKEHIIISGTQKKYNSKFAESILAAILSGMETDLATLLQTDNLNMEENLKFYLNSQIFDYDIGFEINHLTNIQLEESNKQTEINESYDLQTEFLFADISPKRANEYYSASRFMSYDKDFLKYISNYVLGFEDGSDYRFALDDESSEYGGTTAGSIIHNVLEKMDEWIDDNGSLNETNLNLIIDKILSVYRKQNDEVYFEQTKCQISNLMNTKLLKRNSAFLKNSRKEYSLNLPINNDFITAQIDLLMIRGEDDIEVWDWKSNNVGTVEIMRKTAETYKSQMMVYAYLISFFYPQKDSFKTRLLFTQMADSNAEDSDWTVEFNWNKEDLLAFEQNILQKIELMKSNTSLVG